MAKLTAQVMQAADAAAGPGASEGVILDQLGRLGYAAQVAKTRTRLGDRGALEAIRGLVSARKTGGPVATARETAQETEQNVESGGEQMKSLGGLGLSLAGSAVGAGAAPAIASRIPAVAAAMKTYPWLANLITRSGGAAGGLAGQTAAYGPAAALTPANIAMSGAANLGVPGVLDASRFATQIGPRAVLGGAANAGLTRMAGGDLPTTLLSGVLGGFGEGIEGRRAQLEQPLAPAQRQLAVDAGLDPENPSIRLGMSADPDRTADFRAAVGTGAGRRMATEQLGEQTEQAMKQLGGPGVTPGSVGESGAVGLVRQELAQQHSVLSKVVSERIAEAFPGADPTQVESARMALAQAMQDMEAGQAQRLIQEIVGGGAMPAEQAGARLRSVLGKALGKAGSSAGGAYGEAMQAVRPDVPPEASVMSAMGDISDSERELLRRFGQDIRFDPDAPPVPTLPGGAPGQPVVSKAYRVVQKLMGGGEPGWAPLTYQDYADAYRELGNLLDSVGADRQRPARKAVALLRRAVGNLATEGGMDPAVIQRYAQFADARRALEPTTKAKGADVAFRRGSKVAAPGTEQDTALSVLQAEGALTPGQREGVVGTARAGAMGGVRSRADLAKLEGDPRFRGTEDVLQRAGIEAQGAEAEALAGGTENLGKSLFPDAPEGAMAGAQDRTAVDTLMSAAGRVAPESRRQIMAVAFDQAMSQSNGNPEVMLRRVSANPQFAATPEGQAVAAALGNQGVQAKQLADAVAAMESQPGAVAWLLNNRVQTPQNARRLMAALSPEGQKAVRDVLVGNTVQPQRQTFRGLGVAPIELSLPDEVLDVFLGPAVGKQLRALRQAQGEFTATPAETSQEMDAMGAGRRAASIEKTMASAGGAALSPVGAAGGGAALGLGSAFALAPRWYLDPQRSTLMNILQAVMRQGAAETMEPGSFVGPRR